MYRFAPVTGLLAGLALLVSSGSLAAQQPEKGGLQSGPPAKAPLFNTPMKQKITGFNINPGGAPRIDNGTNLLQGNNATSIANLLAKNAVGTNQPGNNPYGNNPYGNNPYGNNPYGNNPYGGNPYGGNPYGGGYGNPYGGGYGNPYGGYGNAYMGNPSWFWGTGMPTGQFTPFYAPNPYTYQYALNSYFLTNPYLNPMSNPAMSYPFPAGVFNSSAALNALGIGNILQAFPQLPNGSPGMPQFP